MFNLEDVGVTVSLFLLPMLLCTPMSSSLTDSVPSGHGVGARGQAPLLQLPRRKSFFIAVGILIELSKVHETSYTNGKLSISHRPICFETV